MTSHREQSARSAAFRIIHRIHSDDAFSNLLLPQELDRLHVPAQDRAFITDAVYGSLRWQGFLDAVIAAAARRPVEKVDAVSLDILRLGAYQALFMHSADYAVVSTTVDLGKNGASHSSPGFLNAVMRAVTARTRQEWEAMLVSRIPKNNPDRRLALRYSHPQWIVEKFRESWNYAGYSLESGQSDSSSPLEELLAADNEPAEVVLCARPGLITVKDLVAQVQQSSGGTARWAIGSYSPYALHVKGLDPGSLPAVRQNLAGAEDEGSQLAALALVKARKINPAGEQWLDMCAGPGGKAALLAACAYQETSAESPLYPRARAVTLIANEPAHHRANLVRKNLSAFIEPGRAQAIPQQTGIISHVTEWDGRDIGEKYRQTCDRILVDAPCSGLGALRRRPESRWRKQPEDIANLTTLQMRLLDSAYLALKPGGILAYVTCSPVLEETSHQVDALLNRHPDLSRLDTRPIVASISSKNDIPLPGRPGDIQLFEHLHGTDQMFISLLVKKG